jgi:hypothetical protein
MKGKYNLSTTINTRKKHEYQKQLAKHKIQINKKKEKKKECFSHKKNVPASKVSGVFVEETRHLAISRRQQNILLKP